MRRLFLVLSILISFVAVPLAHAAKYEVDTDHSSVTFKIRHLLSHVQGSFNKFSGEFEYDLEKPETWNTAVTVDATSIDTNVEPRDKHLRSADFFDVEKFPTLAFKSAEVTDVTPESAKLHGLLTIHGVEKPVVFDLAIHGVAKDPWGNVRAGFTATVKIDRKDFGLNWNKALETGGVLVGDEVEITVDVEGLQKVS